MLGSTFHFKPMDALTKLDIQEDLNCRSGVRNLHSSVSLDCQKTTVKQPLDDEDPIVSEELSGAMSTQPEDIFAGKPTNGKPETSPKQKRLVSEKQRAHLDRIRVKALESKAKKQRLKKESGGVRSAQVSEGRGATQTQAPTPT